MSEGFNKSIYFCQLIDELQASGAFKTYAVPKGKPDEAWPLDAKQIHFSDEDGVGRNIPGTSAHMGDEPYMSQTRGLMNDAQAHKPTARDVALKVQAIREAITRFMPEDGFRSYLNDFVEHLERPANQKAFADALKNMRRTMQAPFNLGTAELENTLQDESATRDTMRRTVMSSNALLHLDHYPQLVTSIAIYQAAHASYLDDLRTALSHAYEMPPEEHENAMAAVNSSSIDQLRDFVIFPNFMPLVIYAYEHPDTARAVGCPKHAESKIQGGSVSEASWKVPLDHGRMHDAIGTAWDIFFAQRLLTARFNPEGLAPVPEICPANKHLQHAKDSGVLQDIYSRVIDQTGKLEPYVQQAREASAELASNRSRPPG